MYPAPARHLPSPEEIREKTAEIRRGWTEGDYRVRATCSAPVVDNYGQPPPPPWEVPFIRLREIGIREEELPGGNLELEPRFG